MRIARYLITVASFLLLIPGCGGGDKDKVGSLTLEVTSTALDGGQYSVSAMATYTNPNKADLLGTEITFDTDPSGLVVGLPATISTPTNGKQGINFFVPQGASAKNFFVIARTGGLEDSKAVSIPALGALAASPATLTFLGTDGLDSTKTITVSGGTAPYTAKSSSESLATAAIDGSTVTVTRKSTNAGTLNITIEDASKATKVVPVSLLQ